MYKTHPNVAVKCVIQTEADVHIVKRHHVGNRDGYVDGRSIIRDRNGDVTGTVVVRDDIAGAEVVSNRPRSVAPSVVGG